MQRTKKTIDYLKKAFPEGYGLETLDPELAERFENFAFDETVSMDDHMRMLAILAALMGCQGLEEFQVTAPAALRLGVTAIELKEIIYQAVAYLGMGRVRPFLRAANDLLAAQAVPLPLARRLQPPCRTGLRQAARLRWKYLAKGCGISGALARKIAGSSTDSWQKTALGIIILGAAWT